MKPGIYEVTAYEDEFECGESAVTVSSGATSSLAMAIRKTLREGSIFTIGKPTGSPFGFKNATEVNFITMHPSDVRMAPWTRTIFTVGTSSLDEFPAIQCREINSPTRIAFRIDGEDLGPALFTIGVTCAFKEARPKVTINGWRAPIPRPPSQPTTRCFTLGTYRGNNHAFRIPVPDGVLSQGPNTIDIDVECDWTETGWRSGGWVYDYLDLRIQR